MEHQCLVTLLLLLLLLPCVSHLDVDEKFTEHCLSIFHSNGCKISVLYNQTVFFNVMETGPTGWVFSLIINYGLIPYPRCKHILIFYNHPSRHWNKINSSEFTQNSILRNSYRCFKKKKYVIHIYFYNIIHIWGRWHLKMGQLNPGIK